MSTSGNLDALVERVLSRAREEATSVVDRANKAAERQVHEAEAQCVARQKAAQVAADEASQQRLHSRRAGMQQEQRRAVMNAREAAVNEVFADALQTLSKIDDVQARCDLLVVFVGEGARALCVSVVSVRLNAAEQDLARTPEFPQELDGVRVTIEDETIETSGGPVVTDETGRIVFENTFEARLDRSRGSGWLCRFRALAEFIVLRNAATTSENHCCCDQRD